MLRSQPRVDVPDALRYRVLAAFERGERPVRPAGVWAWAGGLAAAAVLLVAVPMVAGFEGSGRATTASAIGPSMRGLRIRVVDDPGLGMTHGDAMPGDALLADAEGP